MSAAGRFGFGVRRGRVLTYDREPAVHGDAIALRVPFIPTPPQFQRLAAAFRPALMILPPVSPYSHLAFAMWSSGVAVLATPEVGAFAEGQFVSVDFGSAVEEGEPIGASARYVRLLAEIEETGDCERALASGASGLGVVRVEQLIGDPGQALASDLVRILTKVPDLRPLKVRFFDTEDGIPGLSGRWLEPKPGLGMRGARVLGDTHLRAQFRGAIEQFADFGVVIVLPMVSTPLELAEAEGAFRDLGFPVSLGVTIETPAAAVLVDKLLPYVSYVELGLNDLSQYTLAWDRNVVNEALLPHDRPADAVATLVGTVAASCRAADVDTAIGLDLRPSRALADQLAKLGVDYISSAAALTAPWRRALEAAGVRAAATP